VFAIVPSVVSLGTLAAVAPSTPAADLLGGLSAAALLLWLAGGPESNEGVLTRSLPTIGLVALILLIAWASVLLLPPSPALLGVGGLLLVSIAILVAILFGRPDLIDREPSATA
jgi:apolipoprotein N-acyltransferase